MDFSKYFISGNIGVTAKGRIKNGEKRPKMKVFAIWPNMQMAECSIGRKWTASGPPLARARFSPLALDSANFTV